MDLPEEPAPISTPITLADHLFYHNVLLRLAILFFIVGLIATITKVYFNHVNQNKDKIAAQPASSPTIIENNQFLSPTLAPDSPSITDCLNNGLKFAITLVDEETKCEVDERSSVQNMKVTFPTGQMNITTTALGRGFYCLPPLPEEMCMINGERGVNRNDECISDPQAYNCEVNPFYNSDVLFLDMYKDQSRIGEIYGLLKNNSAYISIIFNDKDKIALTDGENQFLTQIIKSIRIIE